MSELVINPSGIYTDYFIVSFDEGPYDLPERGADIELRLRGRVPSRYELGGMDADFGRGADEEGVIVVERFLAWDEHAGPGGVIQFEGLVRRHEEALRAKGTLAFGSLEMPAGILAMLSYEGLSLEKRRALSTVSSPPLGTLRMY